jgi:hypothetical protein
VLNYICDCDKFATPQTFEPRRHPAIAGRYKKEDVKFVNNVIEELPTQMGIVISNLCVLMGLKIYVIGGGTSILYFLCLEKYLYFLQVSDGVVLKQLHVNIYQQINFLKKIGKN